MPRKKKVASTFDPMELLREENKKLKARLDKVAPKRAAPSDGSVTFKSPWPKFQVRLRRGNRIKTGYDDWQMENPIFAEFDNQVCTFGPNDTFIDPDGKTVLKIDRMREIYKETVAKRKRPQFLEVTEDTDLKIQTFRDRIPPAQLIEFRGPLVDLPPIPSPPPEARETIDTLEGRRRAYGA